MSAWKEIGCDSWGEFCGQLSRYLSLGRRERDRFIFRGHADAEWPLQTTLDRARAFTDDTERSEFFDRLLREFQRECSGLGGPLSYGDQEMKWRFLARHHGLPTPILDWTRSPYIAAFFAFAPSEAISSKRVAVWVLDRDLFADAEIPSVEITEDDELIEWNLRAVEQKGVFLKVNSVEEPVENLLAPKLYRYTVPTEERGRVLAELDEMGLSWRSLFRDLDAAARTARDRLVSLGGDDDV